LWMVGCLGAYGSHKSSSPLARTYDDGTHSFERGRYVLGLTDLREPLFVRSRLAKRSVRDGNCWTKDRWTLRRDNNPVLGHTRSFLSGHEDCCHRRWQIRLRSHSQADVASIVTLQRRKRRTHDPFFRAQALPVCEGGVGMLCFSDFPQSDVGNTKAPGGMDHRLCPDELKERVMISASSTAYPGPMELQARHRQRILHSSNAEFRVQRG